MRILKGQRYKLVDYPDHPEDGEIVEVIKIDENFVRAKCLQVLGKGLYSSMGREDGYSFSYFTSGCWELLAGQDKP